MAIDPDTKQRLVGAALGALGVTAVYGIFRHREEIFRPALATPPSSPTARVHVRRFKKRRRHRDNERGEYGHRRRRRHRRRDDD